MPIRIPAWAGVLSTDLAAAFPAEWIGETTMTEWALAFARFPEHAARAAFTKLVEIQQRSPSVATVLAECEELMPARTMSPRLPDEGTWTDEDERLSKAAMEEAFADWRSRHPR